jgi:hypothetical protein
MTGHKSPSTLLDLILRITISVTSGLLLVYFLTSEITPEQSTDGIAAAIVCSFGIGFGAAVGVLFQLRRAAKNRRI